MALRQLCTSLRPLAVPSSFQGRQRGLSSAAVLLSKRVPVQAHFAPSLQDGMMFGSSRFFSSQSMIPEEQQMMNAQDFAKLSDEELLETSDIPGWDLIHTPPGKMPRGALVGTVVSTKMQKTINVAVVRHRLHPKVRKRISYTRKFMAHDELEVGNLGDLVMITPCHKISKMKHFLLRKVIRARGKL